MVVLLFCSRAYCIPDMENSPLRILLMSVLLSSVPTTKRFTRLVQGNQFNLSISVCVAVSVSLLVTTIFLSIKLIPVLMRMKATYVVRELIKRESRLSSILTYFISDHKLSVTVVRRDIILFIRGSFKCKPNETILINEHDF